MKQQSKTRLCSLTSDKTSSSKMCKNEVPVLWALTACTAQYLLRNCGAAKQQTDNKLNMADREQFYIKNMFKQA